MCTFNSYYLFNVLMMAYAYLVEKNTIFTGSKITSVRHFATLTGSALDLTIRNIDCFIFVDPLSTRTEHRPSLSSLQ